MNVERELKFLVGPDVVLPDLTAVIEGAVVDPPVRLELSATYYDTVDLALARSGVTLRSRTGEAGVAPWTLKLPIASGKGSLDRQEIEFDAPTAKVPQVAENIVSAYSRRSSLTAVAELRTGRTTSAIRVDGTHVASLCDDLVDALVGGARTSFREIEFELVGETVQTELLTAVLASLRKAGCHTGREPLPKVIRVLGAQALEPPDVVVEHLGRKATMSDAVAATVAKSVKAMIAFDAGTRIGAHSEDLHQFRVATRRLRSDLRTFRSLLDVDAAASLKEELKWLDGAVGAVRDLDVLRERLKLRLPELAEVDAATAGRLLGRLDRERSTARESLVAVMSSDRYLDLLGALVSGVKLVVREDDTDDQLAVRAFPALVRKPSKKLFAALETVSSTATAEELHAVRILAKRSRYSAEAAAGFCGRDARRYAARMKDLQTVLGAHQDTIITESWLRQAAKTMPSIGVVAGLLISFEIRDRAKFRKAFTSVSDNTMRPSIRKWLK